MPTNESIIEIVKFTQSGVDTVAAGVKALDDRIKDATARQKMFMDAANSPVLARWEAQLRGVNQQTELMGMKLRNSAAEMARLDGSAAKFMESTKKLNAQHDITALKLRNVVAARGLADGSEVKHIRDVERLNREHERTRRILEYTAKYGDRIGRFAEAHGGKITAIGGALAGAAGMGLNLARQGFQGTTEGARQDFEWKLLTREFASVMKPVHDLATRAIRGTRERMEKLDGRGQNALMAGMLVGGTAAGALALRASSQLIGTVAGEAMASKFRSGLGRFALGGLGAGALGYGIATNNVSSGVAGGAMLGFSMGGLPGAIVGGVGGGLAARSQGLPDRLADQRLWFGRGENDSYYASRRAAGRTKFGAGVDTGLENFSSAYYGIMGRDTARRDVQVSGGGFDAPGTAAERINVAAERVKTEPEGPKPPGEPGTADKMLKALEDIRDAFTTGDGWKRGGGMPFGMR